VTMKNLVMPGYPRLFTICRALAVHVIGLGCLMASHLLIAAKLNIESYRDFTLLYHTYLLCFGLATTGFSAHLLYAASRLGASKDLFSLASSVSGVSLLLGTVILILASLYIREQLIIGVPFFPALLFAWVTGSILVTLIASILQGLGRGVFGYVIDSLLRNGLFLLFLFVILQFVPSQKYLTGVVIAAATSILLVSIFAFYALKRSIAFKGGQFIPPSSWAAQVLILAGTGYAFLLLRNSDVYALSYFGSSSEVASYGVSLRIAELALVVPNLLNILQIPKYVMHVRNKEVNNLKNEMRLYRGIVFSTGIAFVVFALFLSPRALQFINDGYAPAAPFLKALIIGFVLSSAFMNVPAVLLALNKEKFLLISGAATSLLGIFLVVSFTALWRIWGTVIALPLSLFTMYLVWFIELKRTVAKLSDNRPSYRSDGLN